MASWVDIRHLSIAEIGSGFVAWLHFATKIVRLKPTNFLSPKAGPSTLHFYYKIINIRGEA